MGLNGEHEMVIHGDLPSVRTKGLQYFVGHRDAVIVLDSWQAHRVSRALVSFVYRRTWQVIYHQLVLKVLLCHYLETTVDSWLIRNVIGRHLALGLIGWVQPHSVGREHPALLGEALTVGFCLAKTTTSTEEGVFRFLEADIVVVVSQIGLP